MRKAVFISLLMFVAVMLSSCAWLFNNQVFDLTGKWILDSSVAIDNETSVIGEWTTWKPPFLAEITQNGTNLSMDLYAYYNESVSVDGVSTTTYYAEFLCTLKGNIVDQIINAATTISIDESTAVVTINGNVINDNYMRLYLTISFSSSNDNYDDYSITLICEGSKYDWSDELLDGITLSY